MRYALDGETRKHPQSRVRGCHDLSLQTLNQRFPLVR